MKKIGLLLFSLLLLAGQTKVAAEKGYKIGDSATDLKNIDNKTVSLANYTSAKGFIVVFTCNHCPYAKAYEDRVIALNKKYSRLGPNSGNCD